MDQLHKIDYRNHVYIKGLDKAEVLLALYNSAANCASTGNGDLEKARKLIGVYKFETLNRFGKIALEFEDVDLGAGRRSLGINLSDDTYFNSTRYNDMNYTSAENAISELRSTLQPNKRPY